MKNKRLIIILTSIVILLMIPLIAMQFTNKVDWSAFDFAILGILLFATGLSCEFVMRKLKTIQNRLIICGFILFALFLIMAELAVGVFGSPFAGF